MGTVNTETMKEKAFGIIPLCKMGGVWNLLLVKHQSGDYWSFPKGHPIEGEEPKQTAIRELKEETGLEVERFIVEDEISEKYQFERNGVKITKTVIYFIAEVSGSIFLQLEELSGGKWIPLFEAESHITYSESKNVCQRVLAIFDRID